MKSLCCLIVFAQFVLGQEAASSPAASVNYVLGPNDQLEFVIPALAPDFSGKPFRVDGVGDLTLPVVGTIHVGGRTVQAVQDDIKDHLRPILQQPDVVINVTEFASQPVSVLGAVMQPGIRQLQGHKTLFDVLSLSGGLRTDAGTTVEITRDLKFGALLVPDAKTTANGRFSVATVRLRDVMDGSEENVAILPGDTVFVPKAAIVYAVGSVAKPGGYAIGEDGILSALQMVSLAGGLERTAALDKAKILRLVPGSPASRKEIDINIKQLMAGKTPDVPLQANDILFVPNSGAKTAGFRTIEAMVTAATGIAIYGGKL